jgi:hypothetical protein
MSLRIKQEAVSAGDDWWRWSVWLDGPAEELKKVDHVVYTLHPTFPSPVRKIKDGSSQFRLDSAGWGEFEINVEIVPKEGRSRKLKHWLKLSSPETRAAAQRGAKSGGTIAPRQPVVFLSYGVADTNVARSIMRALKGRGVEVIAASDAPAGVPFERTIEDMLGRADAAVFVISGRPSLWVARELETALKLQVPHILPVVLGESAELPRQLQSYQSVRLEEIDGLEEQIQKAAGKWLGEIGGIRG